MKKIVSIGLSVAVALAVSGCGKKPHVEEKDDPERLTIEKAEKIIAERNSQLVVDISKLTKVVAILTKRIKVLEQRIEQTYSIADNVQSAEAEVALLNEKLLELEKIKERYLVSEKELKGLGKIRDEYLKERDERTAQLEKKRLIDKEKNEFKDASGKVQVKFKTVNLRKYPIVEPGSKSDYAHKDEIFEFNGESEDWYKLDSGLFVSKKVVCDVTNCGARISPDIESKPLKSSEEKGLTGTEEKKTEVEQPTIEKREVLITAEQANGIFKKKFVQDEENKEEGK